MSIEETISDALGRYEREYDRYLKLSDRVAEICRSDIVEGNAIRAQVTSRAKSIKSLEGKLRKWAKEDEATLVSVDAVFAKIRDLSAVRVATYDKDVEERVVQEIVKRFCGLSGGDVVPDKKDKHTSASENFYRSTHCEVFLRTDELVGTYANLSTTPCEIQVCSMMAHVWNEIEHDLGYKPMSGALSNTERELLVGLGHLSRSGDALISQLLLATDARLKDLTGAFQDVYDFVARIRHWFPSVDFANNAGQLFEELQQLKKATPKDLEDLVGDVDKVEGRAQTTLVELSGKFKAAGHTRYALDESSSDLLLVCLLPNLAPLIVDNHPTGRGVGGPPRIAWIASRYVDVTRAAGGAA